MNASREPILLIAQDEDAFGHLAAEVFANRVKEAVERTDRATVVLSGGNTPRPLYRVLATERSGRELPWEKIHLFWGDERIVPSQSEKSNFGMAWETMLSRLSIPRENIHRIRTELQDPKAIAEDYEGALRAFFALKNRSDAPRFDLCLLGLGTDGHTASLFPDGEPSALDKRETPDQLVIAPWVPHLGEHRISLTPTSLIHSRHIVFLVSGHDKASILMKVLGSRATGSRWPAQAISARHGQATWVVDNQAAAMWMDRDDAPDGRATG